MLSSTALSSQWDQLYIRSLEGEVNIYIAAGFLQHFDGSLCIYISCPDFFHRFLWIMADLGSWRVVPATNQKRGLDTWTIPPYPKMSEIQLILKNTLEAEYEYQVNVKRQGHSDWSWRSIMQIHQADTSCRSIRIHTHLCRSTHDSRRTGMQTQESNFLVENLLISSPRRHFW